MPYIQFQFDAGHGDLTPPLRPHGSAWRTRWSRPALYPKEGRPLNAEEKSERIKTLTARKQWCEDAVVKLERDMGRTPWMMLGNLVALPVGLLWHIAVALLVVTVVTGFAFTIWYVAWVHHNECKEEIEILGDELDKLMA